jgi:predicted MPP superfamily phosphohydrolase
MAFAEKLRLLVFGGILFCVYAIEIVLIVLFVYGRTTHSPVSKVFWSRAVWPVHILAVIGIVCFLYGYFVEPYWLQVNKFEIRTQKLSGTSFRIVQISDLHCDKRLLNEEKIIKITNSLKPDIIVFTGDSINTPKAMTRFQKTLGDLKAGLGKFAVRGNVDVWYWKNLPIFDNTGFKVLDADAVEIDKGTERLYLAGVGFDHSQQYDRVLSNVPDDQFTLFLYHYPDLIDEVHNKNIDLYLCGHTHGGQVALPFYGAVITYTEHGKKYEAGMYKVGDTLLYVNRGAGLDGRWFPRVRFFAQPEIAVFDIVPRKQADVDPQKIY